jgi:hypothetical protein
VIPVPEGGRKIVTGTPKNIVPCEPTQVDFALSITPQTPDAWLEVIGTETQGFNPGEPPTVFPNLGQDVGERFSQLHLVAPGVATSYAGTFMHSGDRATFFLALTPRAEGLMLLQSWVKELALDMDLNKPTADQIVDLADDLATVPSITLALSRFAGISPATAGATVTSLSAYDPDGLLLRLDNAASMASNDLLNINYTSELQALRALLEKHLGQPVSTNPLKQAIVQLTAPKVLLAPTRAQLFLLLGTRKQPLDISFVAAKAPGSTTGTGGGAGTASVRAASSPCHHSH